MKKTDFTEIAERYDKNQYRHNVEKDEDLNAYIATMNKTEYHLLDLACGTGIYLEKQLSFFHNEPITFHGLDASEEMLEKAKEKVENVSFTTGLAEDIPYPSDTFDYIVNNFAFHHFLKKSEVLDEVNRVLKKDGVFKIHNTSIHDMKNWWLYHYFPSAYFEDLKRYWPKDLIFRELLKRGFDVKITIAYQMEEIKLNDYLMDVENRDISVLTLIDDKEYLKGYERLKNELTNSHDTKIVNDFAMINVIARKL